MISQIFVSKVYMSPFLENSQLFSSVIFINKPSSFLNVGVLSF